MPSAGPGTGAGACHGVIHVGVAGWDYPDWAGIVYPPRSAHGFDRLSHLARFVDCVEINRSFYRPVPPMLAEQWVRRVHGRPGFLFTAKGHRSWTHEPEAKPEEAVPPSLRGLAPLKEAGVLGALLVQFPQSFHRTEHSCLRLDRLLRLVDEWPVVVEVRHASWNTDETAAWLRERGVGWCVVDQPSVGSSTAPARAFSTASVGYFRLHGRNARDWFRDDAGRDARYDYLYSLEELRPLIELARGVARRADHVFVVQNNHFRGKALVNALQWKYLLEQERPAAPATLVSAYPALEDVAVAEAEPGRLF